MMFKVREKQGSMARQNQPLLAELARKEKADSDKWMGHCYWSFLSSSLFVNLCKLCHLLCIQMLPRGKWCLYLSPVGQLALVT